MIGIMASMIAKSMFMIGKTAFMIGTTNSLDFDSTDDNPHKKKHFREKSGNAYYYLNTLVL